MAIRQAVTFSLPPHLVKAVDDLADAQNLPRSALLRRWIEEKIEGERPMVALLSDPLAGAAIIKAFSDPAVIRAMAAVVGEKVTDDQLQLFHRKISESTEVAREVLKKPKRRQGGKRGKS